MRWSLRRSPSCTSCGKHTQITPYTVHVQLDYMYGNLLIARVSGFTSVSRVCCRFKGSKSSTTGPFFFPDTHLQNRMHMHWVKHTLYRIQTYNVIHVHGRYLAVTTVAHYSHLWQGFPPRTLTSLKCEVLLPSSLPHWCLYSQQALRRSSTIPSR